MIQEHVQKHAYKYITSTKKIYFQTKAYEDTPIKPKLQNFEITKGHCCNFTGV